MRLCEWCGAPIDEWAPLNAKYCCDKCKSEVSHFQNLFYKFPDLPHEIAPQEHAWGYLFRRLNKAEPDMTLEDVLSSQEWELMMDLIEAFNHRRVNCPNEKRLIQLGAIGEKLLSIPMNARWDKVPANTRAMISWYAQRRMGTLTKNPRMLIPSKPEKDENQTRKKRR